MSKLISFYSGMGMSVDGTELIQNKSTQTPTEGSGTATPVQGSTRKTDSTIVVNNAETLNEFSKFLRDKLNGTLDVSDKRAFDITAILRDATERGVPLTLKDLGVVSVSDVGLTNVVNDNIPQMKYAVMNTIPEAVKNVQPVVINNHYDSLINVEGSVDKSFSKEFTQNSDKLYKDFTKKLSNEIRVITGTRPVRRSI